MAEGIALAASITALVGVAGTAAKVSKSLIRAARDIKYADEDIHKFAVDIRTFASIIKIAHHVLHRRVSNPNLSEVLEYLDRFKVLDDLLGKSQNIEDSMKKVKPKIKSLVSSVGLWTRVKWLFFNKDEILKFGPQMESVKTSLIIIMDIVKMDEINRVPQTDETREEM